MPFTVFNGNIDFVWYTLKCKSKQPLCNLLEELKIKSRFNLAIGCDAVLESCKMRFYACYSWKDKITSSSAFAGYFMQIMGVAGFILKIEGQFSYYF